MQKTSSAIPELFLTKVKATSDMQMIVQQLEVIDNSLKH
jgi:hypothetical protein